MDHHTARAYGQELLLVCSIKVEWWLEGSVGGEVLAIGGKAPHCTGVI
jgi:hypothetical protein